MNTSDDAPFDGAKVALFLGAQLIVIQRDDFDGLPFAGYWDLPGGGREADESPFECVQRECLEELGLRINQTNVVWSKRYENTTSASGCAWFFVAQLPETAEQNIVFGDEGQCWTLMKPDDFLNHSKAVPAFQDRLRHYLAVEQ